MWRGSTITEQALLVYALLYPTLHHYVLDVSALYINIPKQSKSCVLLILVFKINLLAVEHPTFKEWLLLFLLLDRPCIVLQKIHV
ncbi:hypothetical protein TNIN_240371 [Trichonephila inaurata madagascariensis]|uniref:Uncharacterized protein n=1 Tax=Trichonephila inaurata madagascariensis TaxID=2747483 RepID=A0A8X6YRY4_9ARAC|nr:hypothetical protein TNIN_240371 [Trichonephila inaurata madagascariensis]